MHTVLEEWQCDEVNEHEELLKSLGALAVGLRLRRPTAQILPQVETICESSGFKALPSPRARSASLQVFRLAA